jgi:periplasmic divalent cation tolerance protein
VSEAALIWSPFASEGQACAAAGVLLDEGLIACANILPQMRSLYVWNGERGETGEVGVLFKTISTLLPSAIERLEAIHPYDAPAIVGWKADACGAATADWLASLTGAGQ